MSRPSVSVVIPSYNCSDCVADAIASVLRQSFPDFEVIVVNDGSTDDTAKTVGRFAHDPRIRYIEQNNGGLSNARNSGAKAANGEYIAFLDADDQLSGNALERMIAAAQVSAATWCITDILRVTDGTRVVRRPKFPSNATKGILRKDFITRAPFFRAREFFEIGMFDENLRAREDWDINIRAMLGGLRFAYVDEPVYIYHARDGSLSRDTAKMLIHSERILRKHHKYLADAGDREIAGIYAENMWDLARRFVYSTGDIRRALACARESLAYDRNFARVLHPLLHQARRLFPRNVRM